jgi:hypothetical protein
MKDRSGVGKEAMRKRGEMVECSFAHVLDRGGIRGAWLRGRQNVHKLSDPRCPVQSRHCDARHVRTRTPREATSARHALLFVVQTDSTLAIAVISAVDGETAMLFIIIAPKRLDQNSDFVTGLLRTVAQDGHVRRIDEIVIGIEQGQLRRLRRCRCFLEGSFLTGPSLETAQRTWRRREPDWRQTRKLLSRCAVGLGARGRHEVDENSFLALRSSIASLFKPAERFLSLFLSARHNRCGVIAASRGRFSSAGSRLAREKRGHREDDEHDDGESAQRREDLRVSQAGRHRHAIRWTDIGSLALRQQRNEIGCARL